MIFVNALNFALNSEVFNNHIIEYAIKPNAVNSLLIKHYNTEEQGHVYKFIFDYGIEGQSNKDLTLIVKITGENSFELI